MKRRFFSDYLDPLKLVVGYLKLLLQDVGYNSEGANSMKRRVLVTKLLGQIRVNQIGIGVSSKPKQGCLL